MTKTSLTIALLCAAGIGTAFADNNLPGKTGFNVDFPKFTLDVKNADSGITSVIHITSGGGEHDGGFITSAGTNNNGTTSDNSNMFLSTGASFDGQGWKQESTDGKSVFYGSGPAGFRVFAQQNDNLARGTYLTDVLGNIIDGRAKRVMRIGYDGLTTFNGNVQIAPTGGENDGGWITSAGTKDGATNVFISNGASFDAQADKWIQRSPDGYSSFFGAGPAGFRVYLQHNDMLSESNPTGQKQGAPLNATRQVLKIDYVGQTTLGGSIHVSPGGEDNDGAWITSAAIANNIFLSSGASYDAASGQWIQRSTDGQSTMFGAGPSGFRVYMQQSGVQPLAPIPTLTQVMKIGTDGTTSLGSGVQLNTDSARVQPPCDGTNNKAGMIWYTSTGDTDLVQICAKVGGVFGWRNLALQ